jgi:hypothetical protein
VGTRRQTATLRRFAITATAPLAPLLVKVAVSLGASLLRAVNDIPLYFAPMDKR